MVTIIEQNAVCRIVRDGAIVEEYPVAFDPQTTMRLILEINALKDCDGTPIHARYRECRTQFSFAGAALADLSAYFQ